MTQLNSEELEVIKKLLKWKELSESTEVFEPNETILMAQVGRDIVRITANEFNTLENIVKRNEENV